MESGVLYRLATSIYESTRDARWAVVICHYGVIIDASVIVQADGSSVGP